MKKSKVLFSLVLFVISCSGGANKFVGKWKQIDKNDDQIMIVEKKENGYAVYPKKSPDLLLIFTYNKDHDLLTATNYEDVIEIKIKKDSNHMIMNMGGNGETHEFEKVE